MKLLIFSDIHNDWQTLERLLATEADMVVVPGSEGDRGGGPSSTVYYLVHKTPVVTGRDLRNAKPSVDQNGQPAVSFSLKPDGARKFAAALQAATTGGSTPERPSASPTDMNAQ